MLDGRCLISVITVTGLTDTILVYRWQFACSSLMLTLKMLFSSQTHMLTAKTGLGERQAYSKLLHVNSWTCWPLIMWATKNGLDLSTLEFKPPFHLPKLVGFSAHAYCQNKMRFSATLKKCVLQQDEVFCLWNVNSWTCWSLIMWATNNLDLSTLKFGPPFHLPKLVGFSAHAYI